MNATAERTSNIRLATVLVVFTAALGVLYRDVFPSLVQAWWEDPNNSHGFLVPLVSLYLVGERWKRLSGTAPAPAPWLGSAALVLGILALMAGSVGAELFVQRASLILVLFGLILLNLGWVQTRVLTFPVLFLGLAIPVPAIVLNAVAFPLQLFAARAAEWTLFALSIPVLREGNLIYLANTTLEVAEACSGIRSLVSLIALAIVFGYFFHRHWAVRVILAVSALPIAVFANAFRVAGTGILASYFGETAAHGFYHTFSGWLVFVVAFFLLGLEGVVLRALFARFRKRGADAA